MLVPLQRYNGRPLHLEFEKAVKSSHTPKPDASVVAVHVVHWHVPTLHRTSHVTRHTSHVDTIGYLLRLILLL